MKQYNIRLDEDIIKDVNDVAETYKTSVSELIREGLAKVIEEKKNDVYYRLTHEVEECSKQETTEILNELNKLTKEDLEVVEVEDEKIDC